MSRDTASDRYEVIEVLNRYAEALDRRDWALLDHVFTEDAIGNYGRDDAGGYRERWEGREAIVRGIRSFLDACGPSQHLLGNYQISTDGDTATTKCRVRVMHVGAGKNSHLTYESMGWYEDELVRTQEGWRIVVRSHPVDMRFGDPEQVLGHAT